MRLLLDTHVAYWLVDDQSLLTPIEAEILRSPDHQFFASVVSVWELRLKWNSWDRKGQRKGPISPLAVLDGCRRYGLEVITLDPDQAAAPLHHPLPHKDPFDELLLVQAQELGMLLFTRDRKLVGHPQVYTIAA